MLGPPSGLTVDAPGIDDLEAVGVQ